MGRKLIYRTDEERRVAQNIRRMKYYSKNKALEQEKALARYYKGKTDAM